jgi:hypothetical protein
MQESGGCHLTLQGTNRIGIERLLLHCCTPQQYCYLLRDDCKFSHLRNEVLSSFDSLSLFELLDIKLTGCQVHLLAAEVLYSETHPAKLDCIEFLNLVVKFTLWVLK